MFLESIQCWHNFMTKACVGHGQMHYAVNEYEYE